MAVSMSSSSLNTSSLLRHTALFSILMLMTSVSSAVAPVQANFTMGMDIQGQRLNLYERCAEGSVTCNNMLLVAPDLGRLLQTTPESSKSPYAVKYYSAETKHSLCKDGVTPCRFQGYTFEGEDFDGVEDATTFIANLRQASDLSDVAIGRDIVVIGGGMTAIDAAVQSKLLGAMNVTVAYRRGRDAMGASKFEQDLAASKGVNLMFNVQPKALHADNENYVEFIELEYTQDDGSGLKGTGETVRLEADQVFRAIGQTLTTDGGLALDGRKIAVSETGKTSNDKVWAGGDCAAGGDDLTVTAVAEGRDAAIDIHATLMGAA